MPLFSHRINQAAQWALRGIIRLLTFLKINPDHLTFLGFLISVLVAYAFASGQFALAGVIIMVAGLFDMVDGMVARLTDSETPFGAFFDSIMDRYSDLIFYLGLVIWYGQQGRNNYVILVGVCMMGTVLTSYARARAESLIPSCKVGFLERPERMVLLIIGSFYRMEPCLWVIAVLSNWTVVHRILYTRARMKGRPRWVILHMEEKEGAGKETKPESSHRDQKNPSEPRTTVSGLEQGSTAR